MVSAREYAAERRAQIGPRGLGKVAAAGPNMASDEEIDDEIGENFANVVSCLHLLRGKAERRDYDARDAALEARAILDLEERKGASWRR